MFFEDIDMYKCNRTSLNGKQRIRIRGTAKVQQVLGTNGSGKSSLIHIAYCPLPPDKDDFDLGGHLIQRIHHKGHVYHLGNYFDEKPRFTFAIDDGENLNQGLNVKAQLELCKEHLNYDRELHKFLTGKIKFTTMAPAQRRDWIARFSSVDFDYAFRVYKDLQKRYTAAGNVEQWLRDQVVFSRKQMLDPADMQSMRSYANELRETLKLLMNEPKHFGGDFPPSKDQINNLIETVRSETEAFVYADYPETLGATSVDELTDMSTSLLATINQLTGELKVHGENLDTMRARKEKADALLSVPVDELQAELTQLRNEVDALPKSMTGLHDTLLIQADEPIAKLRLVIGSLPSVMATREQLEEINQKVYGKRQLVDKIHGRLEDIDRQISHIHRCAEVTCPSCSFVFKPGIEEGKLKDLNERYSKGHALSETEMSELISLTDKYSELVENAKMYGELEEIRHLYQSKYPGLFAFLEQAGWTKLGAGLAEKTSVYYRDEQIARKRDKLTRRIQEIEHVFATLREEAPELAGLRGAYLEIEERYNDLFKTIQDFKLRRHRVETTIREQTSYTERLVRCQTKYEEVRQLLIDYTNHEADIMVEGLIRKTLETLSVHEQAITENESNETLAKDHENKHSQALLTLEATKVLMDAMSPKTGLIADQLKQQLSGIVTGVNDVIQRVWGYPLYISADIGDSSELDHKFPLTVDEITRADIAAGSTATKEIVDTAFVLTGYYCMNLSDYPLFLDEFGATFDETHRNNLIPMIKDFIENDRFSQILMISHSLDGQTAFPNSETIILDTRNINYPHHYNRHVEFA